MHEIITASTVSVPDKFVASQNCNGSSARNCDSVIIGRKWIFAVEIESCNMGEAIVIDGINSNCAVAYPAYSKVGRV